VGLHDALDCGRELIPLVRAEVARRALADRVNALLDMPLTGGFGPPPLAAGRG
jgi:hypothetical protein